MSATCRDMSRMSAIIRDVPIMSAKLPTYRDRRHNSTCQPRLSRAHEIGDNCQLFQRSEYHKLAIYECLRNRCEIYKMAGKNYFLLYLFRRMYTATRFSFLISHFPLTVNQRHTVLHSYVDCTGGYTSPAFSHYLRILDVRARS